MKMRFLIGLMVVVASVGVLHCAREDRPAGISEETLRQLSLDGEKLMDEEVKRALYGVKQMKDVMKKNEEKHEHLMKSLKNSSDKKKGAAQLTQEVTQKLEEAEEQCKESLKSEWDECRPCLEDACKTFYTSTCRRGFSSFHAKVENFFRRVSSRFGARERPLEGGDIAAAAVDQEPADSPDLEVGRIEASFNRILSKVHTLCERSMVLAVGMQGKLDRVLQSTFLPKNQDQNLTVDQDQEAAVDPFPPERDSGFLQGVGLEEVLDSFFDFGKSVVEEFGAVVTQVFVDLDGTVDEERKRERELFPRLLQNRNLCRQLRRQTSECWQLQNQCEACQGSLLTECPSVRELHVELDQVSQLLDVSREQYDQVLGIVQRHTQDTVTWLSNMAAEFSWVAQLVNANTTTPPQNVFSITTVAQQGADGDGASGVDTEVEVNILNSPPLTLTVPAGLEVKDPAFIQYVTQEALGIYKQRVRFEDD